MTINIHRQSYYILLNETHIKEALTVIDFTINQKNIIFEINDISFKKRERERMVSIPHLGPCSVKHFRSP